MRAQAFSGPLGATGTLQPSHWALCTAEREHTYPQARKQEWTSIGEQAT